MIRQKKPLKEAISNYTIDDLKRLLEIDDTSDYELGIVAQPKSEEVPFAWDAGISIEGNNVIIDGGFAPGGPEGGKVHIEVPFNVFAHSMELRCDYDAIDGLDIPEEDKDFLRNICKPY